MKGRGKGTNMDELKIYPTAKRKGEEIKKATSSLMENKQIETAFSKFLFLLNKKEFPRHCTGEEEDWESRGKGKREKR